MAANTDPCYDGCGLTRGVIVGFLLDTVDRTAEQAEAHYDRLAAAHAESKEARRVGP